VITKYDEYRLVSIDTDALTDAERVRVGTASVARLAWLNGNGIGRVMLPTGGSADVSAHALSLHPDWQRDMDDEIRRYGDAAGYSVCAPARGRRLTAAPAEEYAPILVTWPTRVVAPVPLDVGCVTRGKNPR